MLPEPERHGEGPADCDLCRARDEGIRLLARPEGQAQLYGSWMSVWDGLLPEYPADVADADAAAVADALTTSYGSRRSL
ncbi:hypothetical protein ACFXDH_30330 [Streptomyces sp. NPDC059467]|uniref:hypothetical protein n=1 Tax=Streptomyces sp. NPDC059467 TaxID=3346844 RepID=UPI00369B76A6